LTDDRLIHGFAALIFVAWYLYGFRARLSKADYVGAIAFALLGSWVPDWDLLLGIGFHRSPLTHSALPAILFGYFAMKRNAVVVFSGFCLGLSSHLFVDIIDYGNVIGITGGDADRMFLAANGLVLLAASFAVTKSRRFFEKPRDEQRSTLSIDAVNSVDARRRNSKRDEEAYSGRPPLNTKGANSRGIDMITKVTTYVCITLVVLYFIVAAVANADVIDEMTEIAAKCDVYSMEIASYGHADYIAEMIWWTQFLDGWHGGNQQLADAATSRAKQHLEKKEPRIDIDTDREDYIEADKARASRLLEDAKKCVVVREGMERLAAEIELKTVILE
jgi:hypothetical protein